MSDTCRLFPPFGDPWPSYLLPSHQEGKRPGAWFPKGASLVTQKVKNLPAMQETRVQSLGREDPLEKGMAAHSGVLAWRIPWTEEPGGLQAIESQRIRHG